MKYLMSTTETLGGVVSEVWEAMGRSEGEELLHVRRVACLPPDHGFNPVTPGNVQAQLADAVKAYGSASR